MSFPNAVNLKSSDVKTTYSTKGYPLGTRGVTNDGRSFAYALAGEALTTGIPITSIATGGLTAAGQAKINTTINSTEDLTSTWTSISLSSTWSTWGAIANEYTDGYLVIQESTHANARGQSVLVKSNTAGSTSTTDSPDYTTITFADDDYLNVGCDPGAEVEVVHNEYFDVIENDGTTSLPIVGVPVCEIADNYYFWAQTWGPCVVQIQGTGVHGEALVPSTDSLQGLGPLSKGNATGMTDASYESSVKIRCGYLLGTAPGDTDMGLAFLTIRP